MKTVQRVAALAAVASLWASPCICQETTTLYTDPGTGITFGNWGIDSIGNRENPGQGFYRFGMALPPDAATKAADEYIGILRCESYGEDMTGWCAVSHGETGQMTNALLLMAWPYDGDVLMDFRYTTTWKLPDPYKGAPKVTQISSFVNDTMYEVVYRCQNCFSWNHPGDQAASKVDTTQGYLVFGRAQAMVGPTNPGCPASMRFGFHDNGYGQYGADITNITHTSYPKWAALATKTAKSACAAATSGSSSGSATTSGGPAVTTSTHVATTTSVTPIETSTTEATTTTAAACSTKTHTATYDYIVVGAGAAGIPMADRLSQLGASVLLIEKGPPSSGRWGGTMKPGWLQGTNLTRFDVPGLCNQIWVDSEGVACTDTEQMEGCVLGGGTAVNAGLWWRPHNLDWDYNFPNGWKSRDMVAATDRVFSRIPGTITPSMDGQLYLHQGYDVIASGLNSSGWKYVIPNTVPGEKNKVYGHTTFMFSGGERGGPLATYLVTASQRKNFKLFVNTAVRRLVRTGGHITGVELECNENGEQGFVNVTPGTGRVILAAGTFASAKLLMRSGIGPADQLAVVNRTAIDGPTMISSDQWIELPVGYNLNDHVNTDTEISHPNVTFYDFYAAWEDPIDSDEQKYLRNRTGILAQAAPNIGPMFWEEIRGSDGIVRQLQWTSRVEGSTPNSMIMSQYLGRGSVSRGRMTITSRLSTFVSLPPYLHNDLDKEVIIKGLENIQAALKNVPGLVWITPGPNVTATQYVNSLPNTPAQRRANHWIGSCKMGEDDGRAGGTAVVDLNTKVYGTDNLFVIDASIFPGMVTGNPSASIVVASERAYDRITRLVAPRPGRENEQCGGKNWNRSFSCASGLTCKVVDANSSRCVRTGSSSSSSSSRPPSSTRGPTGPPTTTRRTTTTTRRGPTATSRTTTTTRRTTRRLPGMGEVDVEE